MQACNFIKKEALAQLLSCKFCEISTNTLFYTTPLCLFSRHIHNVLFFLTLLYHMIYFIIIQWRCLSIINSRSRCSIKKGVLENFAKFTGKHLRLSLFFNKVSGLRQTDRAEFIGPSGRDGGSKMHDLS